jgi:hypothetical protein
LRGFEARLGLVGKRLLFGLAGLIFVASLVLAIALPQPLPLWMRLTAVVSVGAILLLVLCYGQQSGPQTVFLLPSMVACMGSLITGCLIIPYSHREENVRPLAAKFLPHLEDSSGHLVAFFPGPNPMLFYLGSRCVEAVRLSQMPADTTHILISPKEWEGEMIGDKLRERGFTQVLTRALDDRLSKKREYLLIARTSRPRKHRSVPAAPAAPASPSPSTDSQPHDAL